MCHMPPKAQKWFMDAVLINTSFSHSLLLCKTIFRESFYISPSDGKGEGILHVNCVFRQMLLYHVFLQLQQLNKNFRQTRREQLSVQGQEDAGLESEEKVLLGGGENGRRGWGKVGVKHHRPATRDEDRVSTIMIDTYPQPLYTSLIVYSRYSLLLTQSDSLL